MCSCLDGYGEKDTGHHVHVSCALIERQPPFGDYILSALIGNLHIAELIIRGLQKLHCQRTR